MTQPVIERDIKVILIFEKQRIGEMFMFNTLIPNKDEEIEYGGEKYVVSKKRIGYENPGGYGHAWTYVKIWLRPYVKPAKRVTSPTTQYSYPAYNGTTTKGTGAGKGTTTTPKKGEVLTDAEKDALVKGEPLPTSGAKSGKADEVPVQ